MEASPSEFLHHIVELDLPIEAKLELVATIIRIASHFADMAWGQSSGDFILSSRCRCLGDDRRRDPNGYLGEERARHDTSEI